MLEEFVAAGVPFGRRGDGFAEHVAAMRACWRPDPVEFTGRFYQVPRATVGPKPYGDTVPLLFGAMTRRTVERAAALADGLVTVALDWDETRDKVRWYRDAGGTGNVVVNTIQTYPDGAVTAEAFTAAVTADAERAAAAGADEMHVSLTLAGVAAPRQVELLAALAEALDR